MMQGHYIQPVVILPIPMHLSQFCKECPVKFCQNFGATLGDQCLLQYNEKFLVETRFSALQCPNLCDRGLIRKTID